VDKSALFPIQVLDEERLQRIEATSLRLLEDVGLEFLYPEALDLWERAGASVDRAARRVRVPRDLLFQQVRFAPETFEMQARNPAHNVCIGGANMVCAPVYGPPFVHDIQGGRRPATLDDFHNFVKLGQMAPQIHNAGGTLVEPEDADQDTRHLDMLYALIKYSDKTFMGSVTSAANARDTVAMAAILGGGREAIAQRPMVLALINVNSPLRFDERMVGALIEYARARQPVMVTSGLTVGTMSPVTLAGTVALQNAETLAGIALAQLVNPGTPVVYSMLASTTDMQTGMPMSGTPESFVIQCINAQFARRYRLPFRGAGGTTTSKFPDAQAIYEAMMGLWASFLVGANFVVHAGGWLAGGLVASYEKFVIDLEMVTVLERLRHTPVPVDEEALAWEALVEVGPGGHFLGTEHTLRHFREAFYRSSLSERGTYEEWQAMGSPDTARRANRLWKQQLAEYEQPRLDPGLDEALRDFVAQRKNGIGNGQRSLFTGRR
jgi:trimethylamine--corrinoid protein Co-methyltransferase